MSKLGKALLGTAAIGGLGGTIVLSILYSSCSSGYGHIKNDHEKKLKEIEDKLTLVTQEKDEANKEKEKAIKDKEQAEKDRDDAIKEKDDAKADLKKLQDSEISLAPCQATETNIDYKVLNERMTERLMELEGTVDSITKKGDDAQKEILTLTKNYQDIVNELGVWKSKAREFEDRYNASVTDNKKLKANVDQTISMSADMSEQYTQEKAKWDAEKLALQKRIDELQAKITETVAYYINKEEECQWHYNSIDERYGKVCYDTEANVKREIWMAGEKDSDVAKKLKEQFEKADPQFKFIDGEAQTKKSRDGQTD